MTSSISVKPRGEPARGCGMLSTNICLRNQTVRTAIVGLAGGPVMFSDKSPQKAYDSRDRWRVCDRLRRIIGLPGCYLAELWGGCRRGAGVERAEQVSDVERAATAYAFAHAVSRPRVLKSGRVAKPSYPVDMALREHESRLGGIDVAHDNVFILDDFHGPAFAPVSRKGRAAEVVRDPGGGFITDQRVEGHFSEIRTE